MGYIVKDRQVTGRLTYNVRKFLKDLKAQDVEAYDYCKPFANEFLQKVCDRRNECPSCLRDYLSSCKCKGSKSARPMYDRWYAQVCEALGDTPDPEGYVEQLYENGCSPEEAAREMGTIY